MHENEGFIETSRGFVNDWDCDENAHYNVQFYQRDFQMASEIYAQCVADTSPGWRSAICRHVRFLRELRSAQSTRILSGRVGEGPMAGNIVHLMYAVNDNSLCATAIDNPGYRIGEAPLIALSAIGEAMPRSISPGPQVPADTSGMLMTGKATITNYGIVRPFETGHDGNLLSGEIVSRMSDAAAHIWDHAGITGEWLKKNGCGRVAVESKLTRLAECKAGEPLRLVSWVGETSEKSFSFYHQFENMRSGQAIASAEVRALILDLQRRRSVPLPKGL
jgi:acyl-CoA thioester hydrolase